MTDAATAASEESLALAPGSSATDEANSDPGELKDWQPVDLGPFLDGSFERPCAALGRRSDGLPLLYPGRVHSLAGESEAGKTWLALLFAQEQMEAGDTVWYIDFEDDAASVVGRLQTLGVAPDVLARRFKYVRPEYQGDGVATEVLPSHHDCSLVIIDGVTEMMGMFGLRPADDVDVAEMLILPRRLAAQGPAVLLLDHVVKDRQARGRYATGSQHKLSGITGAAYLLESKEPFASGKDGRSVLLLAKDRPGAVRASALKSGRDKYALAELVVTADGSGMQFILRPPRPDAAGAFSPTDKMKQISDVLDAMSPDPLTFRDIKSHVGGKTETIQLALKRLIEAGNVEMTKSGSANHHRLVRAYTPEPEPEPA